MLSSLQGAMVRFSTHQMVSKGPRRESLKLAAIEFHHVYKFSSWLDLSLEEQFKGYVFIEIFMRKVVEPFLKLDKVE